MKPRYFLESSCIDGWEAIVGWDMKYGYARVSTDDQTLAMQQDALVAAGCDRVFTDVASGSKTKRSGLEEALAACVEGDALVVWKLDRLGRSISHLLEIVEGLQKKHIGFVSLQENLDTTSACGEFIFHVFAAVAQLERGIIRDRTKAGLAAAKARGRTGGRRVVHDPEKIRRWAVQPEYVGDVTRLCRDLGCSAATYFRAMKGAACSMVAVTARRD